MAGTATRPVVALALLAALSPLAACAAFEPSTAGTSGGLPGFGWGLRRMRAPSAERPPWLPLLPTDLPRFPTPSDGFRA
jgi:hypothetical protein